MKCGNFTSDEAKTLDEIALLGADAIIPVEQVLSYLPKVEFPQELYKKVSCGVSFNTDLSIEGPFTVYCSGEFFGVGVVEGGFFKIKTYLKD